jgi:predicted transcriptional regulator
VSPEPFYFDVRGQGSSAFLGPTEARLMELAWKHPELTVKATLFHLGPGHGLAYTTVMTIMNRLVEKGLLARTRIGRSFVYRAATDRDTFLRGRISQVLDCLQGNFPEHFARKD